LAVIVDIRSMGSDLKAFAKAAKAFLHNHQRLLALDTQLINAASAAKAGDRKLKWTTNIGDGPIATIISTSYRNCNAGKPIGAKISFDFKGSLDEDDDNKFVITSGGTQVTLFWTGDSGETAYHFDIHPNAPGHPMLHIQFDGSIKDVPRLHSIFAHPLDILEFTLMEIFQQTWRDTQLKSTFRSEIRKYPAHQQKRILSLLKNYVSWVESPEPALISLLRTPTSPLELYP
jgi:hypothetical protein